MIWKLSLLLLITAPTFAQKLTWRINNFRNDHNALQRFYETKLSEDGADRLRDFYVDERERLALSVFDSLSREDQVNYILLDHHLRAKLAGLDYADARLEAYGPYLQFADAVTGLEALRRQRAAVDERAWAERVAAISGAIQASRKAVEQRQKKPEPKAEEKEKAETEDAAPKHEPLAKWELHDIAAHAKGAERMLNDWYHHYAQYRPGFDWWLKKPVEDTKKELAEYDKWLREKIAGIKNRDEAPPMGEVVGEERLQQQLDFEMIPYTPAELIARAEAEFEWCAKEMLKAAQEIGKETRMEGLEAIKDNFVPPGEQEDYVVEQARDAIKFCDANQLLTIPKVCRETWRVKMVDEKGQKTLPYAAYGGLNVLVAYATGSMDHEKKLMSMRGNNLHTTRIVTAHEVIPGHHLQSHIGARSRPYRSVFRTPFYVEGWCLYWEMRLYDMDFARSPEDRIGFLFWRMHRCARIIVTLKFHTGQMEPKAMIDFLVNEVGHGRPQATAEVRRYIRGNYSPLYQAAYMLGGMQLKTLHEDLVANGDMSEKEFHDEVLKLGPIPIEMIRASLVEDVKLSADYTTRWKF